MEKKLTFWVDAQLSEKLALIPRSERSTVIRQALRQYFGITPKQDVNQLREIFQVFQSAGR